MARGYQRVSAALEDEIWKRLQSGYAAKPTARALGISTSGVHGYLVRCGGIRPPVRRRAPGRLSLAERRRSPGVWPRGGRCGRSRAAWAERRRR